MEVWDSEMTNQWLGVLRYITKDKKEKKNELSWQLKEEQSKTTTQLQSLILNISKSFCIPLHYLLLKKVIILLLQSNTLLPNTVALMTCTDILTSPYLPRFCFT